MRIKILGLHGDVSVRVLFIVCSSIRMPAVAFDILMSQLPAARQCAELNTDWNRNRNQIPRD